MHAWVTFCPHANYFMLAFNLDSVVLSKATVSSPECRFNFKQDSFTFENDMFISPTPDQ